MKVTHKYGAMKKGSTPLKTGAKIGKPKVRVTNKVRVFKAPKRTK